MKYVKLFEQYSNEINMYETYAKRVGWLMISDDIRTTSGDINRREKKYNMAAKDTLFQNWFTKNDHNNPDVIIPTDIPILNYGGYTIDETVSFFENKHIVERNLYNKRNIISISGNKIEFAKTFMDFDWLPKTVFSKEHALKQKVGFPVIAKIKNGHSGIGIKKFDTVKDLESDENQFDLFCQFIDFDREFRVMFCKDKLFMVNERVPTIDEDSSIHTKGKDDKIKFTYVYQDLKKIPAAFYNGITKIVADIRKTLPLDLWALDVVMDKSGKLWVMETSSATGLGSAKMCEVYRVIYEDYYKQKLPDPFLNDIYKKFVLPGHQNYWPKYKKEIESSPWAMNYNRLTDPKDDTVYRYFFNLD